MTTYNRWNMPVIGGTRAGSLNPLEVKKSNEGGKSTAGPAIVPARTPARANQGRGFKPPHA